MPRFPDLRFLVFPILFAGISATAQEQMGMRLERYAGIYSAALNPANTAFNPQRWDVSLVSADVYLHNSYAFVQNASVPAILREPERLWSIADTSNEQFYPRDAFVQDFYNVNRRMHVVAQARVSGPAFSFRVGENHTFGLETALRFQTSMYRIPAFSRYAVAQDLADHIPYEVSPVTLAAMGWGELGLHYNYRNFDGDRMFSLGATPKILFGYEGGFVRASSAFEFTQEDGDTVAFARVRWDYGLTLGNFNDFSADSYRLQKNGQGLGIDIGAAWAMADDEGSSDEDYAWRIGVSLIDFGAVRFSNGAQRHHIELDAPVAISGDAFTGAQTTSDYIADLSTGLLGSPNASLQANHFAIGLPAALAVQMDYKIRPMAYVSAVWVQRVPVWRYSLKRPNMLAVVPRFEHKWFSASVPVVVDDWRSVRVGFAVRLGYLTFGTDNLGSFLGTKHLDGTDLYVGLKINGFSFGERSGSRRGGGGGMSVRSRRKIKCYSF